MFASNSTIADSHLHVRGQENLQTFTQGKTPVSEKAMTDYFYKTYGALMYHKITTALRFSVCANQRPALRLYTVNMLEKYY